MSRYLCVLMTALILPLAGCSSLTVPGPVGTPVGLGELEDTFDGFWSGVDEDDAGVMALSGVGDGWLRMAVMEWDDETKRFVAKQMDIWVGQRDGGLMYLHLPGEQWEGDGDAIPKADASYEQAGTGYLLLLQRSDDDPQKLTVYPPDYDAWATAVEDGTLEGQANRDENVIDVTVTTEPDAVAALLAEHPAEEYFDIDEPVQLRRIADLP